MVAKDVANLNMPVKEKAWKIYTVRRIKHNLMSLAALVKAGYLSIFE